MIMSNNAEALKSMITGLLFRKTDMSEAEIDKMINDCAQLPIFAMSPLTDEELKMVRNHIHAEYAIKLDLGSSLVDTTHVEWFEEKKKTLEMKYWERYCKYLLYDKKFAPDVINKMDTILDKITDFTGDPQKEGGFQRRGLVIGDVQSGKTANYTGLICKAADAGYKVIILLTGTIEKLRQQTQSRLDEGFIGKDSDGMLKQKDVAIGVGKYDRNLRPMVLTSKTYDFNIKMANNISTVSLNSLNEPVLFVLKKNVTVLKSLNQWLKISNLNNGEKIDTAMLLIDDEADNASINTKKPDTDPTATNAQIVDLLSMFKKASYVGYTATPFANIFINPETDEEMKKENLFPKDYIYSLESPSHYIGARNIFGEEATHGEMLKTIWDGEEFYPISHKIDFVIPGLSPSLTEAINGFLIANAIRDLRGDITKHRSMIVNVSRFVAVQEQFQRIILQYMNEIIQSVRLYSKIPKGDEERNLKSLKETYERDYWHVEYSWDEIKSVLYEAIAEIKVLSVNGNSYDSLDYDGNSENGLRAIVVGGMGLSRGLTLEGLMTSYFYRNSKMYDTLMQMGRWFGYRPNYEDLCKVWMSDTNIDWYGQISEATDELKRDVRRMCHLKKTPLEFGLRVRNDITSLLVTARNKMRTAQSQDRLISLSEAVVETPKLYNDDIINKSNFVVVENLISDIKDKGVECEGHGTTRGYRHISKRTILNFLKNLDISYANFPFDIDAIIKFVENYTDRDMDYWDVAFINGSDKENAPFEIEPGVFVNRSERKCKLIANGELLQTSGTKNRLGSMNDSLFGLTDEQIDRIKLDYRRDNPNKDPNSIPQREYFRGIKRNPLLMIYMITVKVEDEEKLAIDEKTPLVGVSIGFPSLSNAKKELAHYKINLIALKNNEYFDVDEGEDENEYED